MTLERFLEIWNFELNENNFRYENDYWSLDFLLVKDAEKKDKLKDLSFEISLMQRPHIRDMD